MKISTNRFVLSSEAKNSNGFRVRTMGVDMSDFNTNPILLFMHKRPKGESKDEVLPIGNVVDIKVENGKITGRLAFDETDAFAMKLYDKVENGTLRMVSAGLIPLTWKKDDEGELWLETSKAKEISLVDIGSNAEAIAVALYDAETDTIINLSLEDIITNLKPENNMKIIGLNAPDVLPLLQLAEGATPEEVQEAIGNLVTLAATQKTTIGTLTTERDDLQTKYDDGVKLAAEAEITTFLDAQETAGKFVKGDRAKWEKLANADFDGTKDILDGMTANKSVMSQLSADGADETLLKLSYEELDKSGQLITLKEQNPAVFNEKYKAKFGIDYKGN